MNNLKGKFRRSTLAYSLKGPGSSSELSLFENANILQAEALDIREITDKSVHFIEDKGAFLTESVNKVESCLQEVAELQEEYDNLITKMRNAVSLKEHQSKCEDLEEKISKQFEKIEDLEDEKQLLLEEILNNQDYIDWQDQEIERLYFHLNTLSSQLAEQEEMLKTKWPTTRAFSQDGNDPEDVLSSLQKRIDELELTVAQKEKNNKILLNTNQKLKDAFKKVTTNYMESLKNQKLKSDCNCIQEDLEAKLKERDRKIAELEREKELLSEEMKDYEDYITNQVNDMKKLAYYIDCLSEDIANSVKRKNLSRICQDDNEQSSRDICPCVTLLKAQLSSYKTRLIREQENNKTLVEQIKSEMKSKEKIEEVFSRIVKIYEDLVKKNQKMSNEREELKILRKRASKFDQLESENKCFKQEINQCRCYMMGQDAKLFNITCNVECLAQERNHLEEELRMTVINMENHLVESQQQLQLAETELKNSKQQFSFEKLCMCSRIRELEIQIKDYESTLRLKDENSKALLQTLEKEKALGQKMRTALSAVTKNETQLKEMLAQARHTIKSVTQKIEEYDIERLETQRDHQVKISELENQLVIATATIQKLRSNLDQMKGVMDKNVALRTLSAQLHQAANLQVNELQDANEDLSKKSQNLASMYDYLKQVLYEKDKNFDDLRNQLLRLKEQLDNEQKLREDTETVLADVAAAGDTEKTKLKDIIRLLSEEIKRLNLDVDQLMKTTAIGKLKTRLKNTEQDNDSLRKELGRCVSYLKQVLPGYINPEELAKLKKQLKELNDDLQRQKKEVEKQKQLRFETVESFKSKLKQQEDRFNRMKELFHDAKKKKLDTSHLPTVILVEKDNKDDGQVEYRCLYAATKEKPISTDIPKEIEEARRKAQEDPKETKKLKELATAVDQDPIELRKLKGLATAREQDPKELQKLKGLATGIEQDPKELRKLKDLATVKEQDPKELQKLRGLATAAEQDPRESKKVKGFEISTEQDPKEFRRLKDLAPSVEEDPKELKRLKDLATSIEDDPKHIKQLKETIETAKVEKDPKTVENLRRRLASLEKEEDIKKVKKIKEQLARSEAEADPKDVQKIDNLLALVEKVDDPQETRVWKRRLSNAIREIKPATSQRSSASTELTHLFSDATGQMVGKVTPALSSSESSDRMIKKLKEENEKLKEKVKELETLMDPKYRELETPTTKRIEDLEETRDSKYRRPETPVTRKSEDLEEMKNLKRENENLKNTIKDLDEQFKILQNTIIKEPSDKNDFEKVLRPLRETIVMEQNRVIELEALWRNCENTHDVLKSRNDDLEQENIKLKDELLELQEKAKLPTTSKKYESEIANINTDLHKWQNQINDAVTNIEKDMQNYSKSVTAPADFQSVQDLLDQIDRLKEELQDVIYRKRVSVTKLVQEKHLEELETQLRNCQKDNRILKDDVAYLEKTLEDMKNNPKFKSKEGNDVPESAKELEIKLRNCERAKDNLQSEIDRLRFQRLSTFSLGGPEDLSEEEQKMKDLEETINRLAIENKKLREALPPNKSEEILGPKNFRQPIVFPRGMEIPSSFDIKRVKELESRLTECQTNYERDTRKLKFQIETLMRGPESCETHGKVIQDLEQNLEDSQKQIETLKGNIADLEAENARLSKANFSNQDVTGEEAVDQRMSELVEHLRGLERKNETLKTRMIQLELENGRLKNDIERITGNEQKTFEKEMQKLRDLERLQTRCQQKYQHLKKRLVKLEIENKNLKKEYIDTLIEKEKLILQSHEQTRRLRETNKLLRKAQDKKQNLTNRIIRLQMDFENLRQQLDSVLSKELEEQREKYRETDEDLRARNILLERENDKLKEMLSRMNEGQTAEDLKEDLEEIHLSESTEDLAGKSRDDLKTTIAMLEIQNNNLRKELEACKLKEMSTVESDIDQHIADHLSNLGNMDAEQKSQMRNVELQIENDFLKSELANKEKVSDETKEREKKVAELEDEIHKLTETNENLKRTTVELELDNEYMRKEIDRISKIQENLQTEGFEKNADKQNRMLKAKIEKLEKEIASLKEQLNNMSQAEMSLESHTQQKILSQIKTLLEEYQEAKMKAFSKDSTDLEAADDEMETWKRQYEPRILDLKQDLERLMGGEQYMSMKLERQLGICRGKLEKLEQENQNMRLALEILLKEKGAMSNVKLVKEVELQLQQYRDTDTLRQATKADEMKIKDLEGDLEECQNVNKLLKAEKVALDRHVQDKKIQELESQIRRQQNYVANAENEMEKHKYKSKAVDMDVKRTKEMEDELQKLQEGNEKLLNDLHLLRMRLKSCEQSNVELEKEVERLHKISEVQQRVKNDLEKTIKNMKTESEVFLTRNQSRDRRVAFKEPRDRITDYEHEIEALKNEYIKLHEQHEEKIKIIAELQKQLEKCQEKNKELKKKFGEQGAEVEGSESETVDDNDEREIRQVQRDSIDATGQQELPKDSSMKMKVRVLEKRIVETQKKMEVFQGDFEKLREENLALQNNVKRVKELEERLRESNTKYRGMKFELERLQWDNLSVQDKKHEKKATELAKQLRETRIENDKYKAKNEFLRREIEFKEGVGKENKLLKVKISSLSQDLRDSQKENKQLKEEINKLKQEKSQSMTLTKDLVATQNENKQLKEKINRLTHENGDLLRLIDEQKKEIAELETKTQLLGGGEYKAMVEQLEVKNEENECLKAEIADLENKIESTKQELEIAINDMQAKRVRNLEHILCKYQDNNEYLKTKVDQLEKEKTNLVLQLKSYQDGGKAGTQTDADQVMKLETILQKCKDLRVKSSQGNTRVDELEEKVHKCQTENDGLKLLTMQLELEVKCLKRDLANFMAEEQTEKEKKEKEEKRIEQRNSGELAFENFERELGRQKSKWKNIVAKLTEQYEENINLLKKRIQTLVPSVLPNVGATATHPWMVQQPMMSPAYTTMPVFMQPVVTYGNYVTPQVYEQVDHSERDLQQLSDMVDNIQKNIDKNKKAFGLDVKEQHKFKNNNEEEVEEELCDYEYYSPEEIPPDVALDANIAELNKQLLKQQQTREKIEKLQKEIDETVESLKEVSQKRSALRARSVEMDDEMPSTSRDDQEQQENIVHSGGLESKLNENVKTRKSSHVTSSECISCKLVKKRPSSS